MTMEVSLTRRVAGGDGGAFNAARATLRWQVHYPTFALSGSSVSDSDDAGRVRASAEEIENDAVCRRVCHTVTCSDHFTALRNEVGW